MLNYTTKLHTDKSDAGEELLLPERGTWSRLQGELPTEGFIHELGKTHGATRWTIAMSMMATSMRKRAGGFILDRREGRELIGWFRRAQIVFDIPDPRPAQ